MSQASSQPDPAVTSLTAKAGDKIDNYTIMEQVGAGGTAIVFRGHDHVLNRDVAIKQFVIGRDEVGEEIRQRALAEAAIHKRAAATDPRLLVQYIDTVNDPRGLFLISEYIDGPSLEWILQQEPRPMEQRQALGIIAATAKALDALHQAGVVHRDLKPSNILMPREGGLKLADFGLAAVVAEQQTMDLGSVRYMAPEVLQGQDATPKSDLYSLGIVAYEMLAGRDNFNDAFRTILRDQRNQAMRWVKWHTNPRTKVTPLNQLVDGLPESLAQLIARMMEKDPARRVGSATELIDAIRNHFAQGGQGQPAAPGPHAAMAPPQIDETSQTAALPQRSKLPIILAATLAVWVIAIAGFFAWKNHQDQQADLKARTALITDIEDADALIREQDYQAAAAAFLALPETHPDQFDPVNMPYRSDLVEAGHFKAMALLAAEQDDFITAMDNAREYQKRMSQWGDQPSTPRTSMSLINAKKLIEEYDTRAAFQELAAEIQAMLEDGKLDNAIEIIRRTRNNSSVNTAAADVQRLDELERLYKQKLDNERIVELTDEARSIADKNQRGSNNELKEAIRLLETEADRSGADTDPRVTELLAELNRTLQIAQITDRIADAENDEDRAELLAALRDLQLAQPSAATAKMISDLEVAALIEQAEEALADGLVEKAVGFLGQAQERDPKNPQVVRMLGSIGDARSMVEAEKQGDQLFAAGDYKGAIAAFKRALEFGPDTTGTITEKINDATGRIHIAATENALEADDVDKAQADLNKAKKAHGDTGPINELQARIDSLRDYQLNVADGDALFANRDYGRAKARYVAAKKIFDSEAINQKIRECDFQVWLSVANRHKQAREWIEAESALKRAEEIKINDETRALRKKIETQTQ